MNESNETLIVLHTNDIHSHFDEAAQIAQYVKDVRSDWPADNMLLLDCGDHLDRVRLETEGTGGAVNRELVEALGYDAVTIGNNEGLTCTRSQLDALYKDAKFPVLCANMTDNSTGLPPSWMVPTLLIERAGMKIGIIGLTAPYTEYYDLLGWTASEPIEAARRAAAALKEEADVLIALSHLGLKQDERLAAEVPELDLILGGHTHHLLETPLQVGKTVICAAGKFGRYVGVVKIHRDTETGTLRIDGHCVAMDGLPKDPEAQQIVALQRLRAQSAMNVVVADLPAPLSAEPDRESPLGTLLAMALRRKTGAAIGLTNAGQLLDGLHAGPVTLERIHAICPSPINACLIRLSGAQLRRALEESLLPAFTSLAFHGYGFRGRVLGRLCLDGIEVSYDASRPDYEQLVRITVNGSPLEDEREYEVGTLDMFTFGIGHVGLKEGSVIAYYLPEFIRDLLAEALNDSSAVADCVRPRWHEIGQA